MARKKRKAPPPFPSEAYAEALRKESEIRDYAFLGIPRYICGLPCAQLTLRMFMQLCAARSPFMVGGKIRPEDIAVFLWRVSPGYCAAHDPAHGRKRRGFIKKIAFTVPYDQAKKEINEYLDLIFFDAPAGGKANRPPTVSFAATMIDLFADEYGWTEDQVLDSPLPRLYQYVREIRRRKNPKAPAPINRLSDKVKKDWLMELDEFNKRQRK